MIDLFLMPNALPFAIALSVTAGLFLIEIISLLMGATVLGLGGDTPDVDIDADFDLSLDFDSLDFDAGDVSDMSPAPSGILTWIGARDVPFLIWLVSFLTTFGLFGLIIQSLAVSTLGAPYLSRSQLCWPLSLPLRSHGSSPIGSLF